MLVLETETKSGCVSEIELVTHAWAGHYNQIASLLERVEWLAAYMTCWEAKDMSVVELYHLQLGAFVT